jgi:DNA polymerase I-like protein with 3'-5' exonuclease and polymerase domains
VFHNGNCFDIPALLYIYNLSVVSYSHDTIIQANVLNPGFEKSLAFLTSIYTRQPYYKTEGRAELPSDDKSWGDKTDREALYLYNAKDCCVTLEIHEQQYKEIQDERLNRIYDFSMDSAHCAIDISNNGLLRNNERAVQIKEAISKKIVENYSKLWALSDAKPNARSPKDIPNLLYEKLNLPKKYNKDKNLTADEDSIIENINFCKSKFEEMKTKSGQMSWAIKLGILQLILMIRGDEKLLSSYIDIEISLDNRVRSIYKSHGTETGRWSAGKFIDGTGLNAQTLPRESVEISYDDSITTI